MHIKPREPIGSSEPPNFNEIKGNIYKLVSFDPGLNRVASFKPPRREIILKKEPVEVLNRASFIAETLEKLESDPTAKAAFLTLDLSDMHFADKAGAGDFVLNIFTRTLKEALLGFRLDKNLELDRADLKVCRYGGDEFSISLVGQYDDKMIEELRKDIEKKYRYGRLMGYFKKGLRGDDPIVEEPIRLKEKEKGRTIDVVERPKKLEEQIIFDQFLKKGHILTPIQIKTAQRTPELLEFGNTPIEPTYPKTATTIKEKLDYLNTRFPRLRGEIATLLGNEFNDIQREEIIHFLEGRLFDKLFSNIVYSAPEFFERLGSYKDIYCFDLKFIREMNDIVSYPEADMAIVSLYKLITDKLTPDLMPFVDIGRRGGTFFVGAKRSLSAPISARDRIDSALDKIYSLPLSIRGKQINLDLGINSSNRDRAFTTEEFSNILEGAEANFYRKIANHLVKKKSDGRTTNLEYIFSDRDFKSGKEELNPYDAFIQEFFISKRSLMRANKMLKEIGSGELFKSSVFNELRVVMNKIYNYGYRMKEQDKPIDQRELLGEIQEALK